MYSQKLLDHYRYSSFKGLHTQYDFFAKMRNPSCGDEVSLSAILRDNSILEMRFDGSGCVISQAAASMFCQMSIGKSLQAIDALTIDDMLNLIELPLGPVRARCAYLPLEAFKKTVADRAQSS